MDTSSSDSGREPRSLDMRGRLVEDDDGTLRFDRFLAFAGDGAGIGRDPIITGWAIIESLAMPDEGVGRQTH